MSRPEVIPRRDVVQATLERWDGSTYTKSFLVEEIDEDGVYGQHEAGLETFVPWEGFTKGDWEVK